MPSTSLQLPAGYHLERDPDLLFLRRPDGDLVAAFSALTASEEEIRRTAEEAARGKPAGTTGAGLRARFFGGFELLLGGAPVPPCRNAKALTILKYLISCGGRPVSRDFLMGWLWPDASATKARWSLNSCVHVLRRSLDGCLPARYGGLVLYDEGHYRLCPGRPVASDVGEFDERYARGRRLEQGGDAPGAVAEYEAAVAVYRGDYLPEDLYEDWTMVERERLANAHVYMLDRLAALHAEAGRYQRSAEVCYRILDREPCHEESHRRLMGHHARLGLREQALRQYRVCARMLKSRHGADPSRETRAVYGSVLAGGANGTSDGERRPGAVALGRDR